MTAPAVKDKRKTNGKLLACTAADLQRARGAMAYEDGYADAREYGKDGFFMPLEWNITSMVKVRERYLAGFRAGLRVREARAS